MFSCCCFRSSSPAQNVIIKVEPLRVEIPVVVEQLEITVIKVKTRWNVIQEQNAREKAEIESGYMI